MPKSPQIYSLGILIVFGLFLFVACLPAETPPPNGQVEASSTAKVTVTPNEVHTSKVTSTPVVTRLPTDTPDEIEQNCCANLRSALLEPPTTLNYWRYLAEDPSPWTRLVLGDQAPTLFTSPAIHLPQRLDFIPALAFDLPSEAKKQGDFWEISVELISNATWSDGQPITAHDIVFTVDTVFDLKLPGYWAEYYPEEILAKVEAKDDHTIAFYFEQEPGLGEWEFAIAKGPILPEHYWSEYVEQAKENIEGIAPPLSCSGQLTLEEVSACQAYERARQILFEIDPVAAPSGGGYLIAKNISSAVQLEANPNFYAAGIKITEYANGTWERVFPDGTSQQFFGEAAGKELLSYHRGPFSPAIEYKIFETPAKAYDALLKGNLDAIFNPYGQTDDWILQTIQSKEIVQYPSQQNGLVYLGFNLRRAPGSLPEFRQA